MLPLSLRKLAKTFQVNIQKGYFPYRFVNKDNLDYIGMTPDISFFDIKNEDKLDDNEFLKIKMEIYNNLISTTWNLRSETIKYCIDDCVSLHQIIKKFNFLIFDSYKLNINNYPTLPSLAVEIYTPSLV
jgi:hypothetical protein